MILSDSLLWIVVFLLGVWVLGITFLLLRTLANYNRLTKGASEHTLSEALNRLLDKADLTDKELKRVLAELEKAQEDGRACIQKTGLVRFNPFSDTGGDQSFSLALLDADDNGIIVTSLYARTGVRWYVKTLHRGKGAEHELSKEESEALKKAQHAK